MGFALRSRAGFARVVRSELRNRKLFVFDMHRAAGSFLVVRSTNPHVAQFEEISSVGLSSTKIRI